MTLIDNAPFQLNGYECMWCARCIYVYAIQSDQMMVLDKKNKAGYDDLYVTLGLELVQIQLQEGEREKERRQTRELVWLKKQSRSLDHF